ncbi:S-layer homology domain-containing protein [Anaerosphaera multitolerans]|uniref:S-layer homology domain-containing protein n=1 Tax=Anaerosphaera multitolerans TaxID=2487351 RepID=A0A437S6Z4_9FIRM|nr:S-layer homology domain-containing protein [Anaerosphaera multitolerans]RVU54803.1 S-layer homology domain-containing protein [Anaerosphaera multitolerans]
MNNKKITKAISLGLCAVLLIPSAVYAKEFKDVKKSEGYGWAYDYIDEMSDKGVIEGYPDNTFKPDKAVNFEETLQLLKGIINPSKDEVKKAVEKYGEACEKYGVSSWAKEAVAIGIDKNIITEDTLKEAQSKGFIDSKNLVYPNRNTIAVYFGRGLNLSSSGDVDVLKHKDIDKIPASTKGYLASLVEAGIFSATGSEGNFDGDRYIRRSEMAKITKLSYDYKTKAGSVSTETKDATGTVVLTTDINNLETIIIEKDSKRSQFRVNTSTTFKMNDKSAVFSDIKSGQEVKITYTESSDSTITGIAKTVEVTNSSKDLIGYITATNSNGITVKYTTNKDNLDIKSEDINTTDSGLFELASNAKIYELGKEVQARDLTLDSLVEFKTDSSGKVTDIISFPKTGTVTGEVISISSTSGNDSKETIRLKLSNGKTYTFYGNYIRSGNSRLFDDIRVNDKVTLTTNYKNISRVGEKGENLNIGRIVSVYRGSSSGNRVGEIVLEDTNGNRNTYYLTDATSVYDYNGIKRAQMDLDSLEGMTVELDLDGSRVLKIKEIDEGSIFDTVAQVIDIQVKSGAMGSTTKTYTIRVVNDGKKGDLRQGEVFTFDADVNYDRYTIIRIAGYKVNGDLGSVTIDEIAKEKEIVDYYDYDTGRGTEFI